MFQKAVKIFGKELLLTMRNDGDQAVANEIFRDRDYRVCDKVIKNAQQAIVDIGAHLGFFALYAATLNSKASIYSFEPHVENYQFLKQNLKQNRIKRVFSKNVAVAGQVGEVALQISQEDLNHSIVHAIEDVGERQKVHATTLQRLIKKQEIGQVDLLKMDCEGAEFQILLNTPTAIFDKVSTIFLEYHNWVPGQDHRKLKKYLEQMGYQVRDYPNSKMSELGFLWVFR